MDEIQPLAGVDYEDLYESFLDLERLRCMEAESRQVSEILLTGLRVLTGADTAQEGLDRVLGILQDSGAFSGAFVLVEESTGVFKVASSTKALFEGTTWHAGSFFKRILNRMKPGVIFETREIPEWGQQPEAVYKTHRSAVHAPFVFGQVRAILTCIKEEKGGCSTADAKLLLRLAPLLEEALLTMQRLEELRRAKAALQARSSALESTIEQTRILAKTDFLTGLPNRRSFFETGSREINRAHRYKRPLSLLLMDLDYFKSINDHYGHDVGDRILVSFASLCGSRLREHDFLARIGGEEFAVLMPETTQGDALYVADDLRQYVAASCLDQSLQAGRVTVSIGVAELVPGEMVLSKLLKRADEALYSSKQQGRNQVCPANCEYA